MNEQDHRHGHKQQFVEFGKDGEKDHDGQLYEYAPYKALSPFTAAPLNLKAKKSKDKKNKMTIMCSWIKSYKY